ncbi:MAG: hypothetical protein QM680_09755 [Luteolibacter sp.]
MNQLVTASFVIPAEKNAPDAIVYLPEGKHRIFPQSHPDGVEIHMPAERGEAIAASLNSQLQERRQQNVIPWLDLEHTGKAPATGYPITAKILSSTPGDDEVNRDEHHSFKESTLVLTAHWD